MATKAEIMNLLSKMQEPKGHKKTFAYYLNEAWELFGLDGDPDLVSLEALLIEAIIRVAAPENESTTKKAEAAKKRDIGLLALGLLDGYYHTKEDDTNYMASERHKDYLVNSEYIALSYPNPRPSDNLSIQHGSLPCQAISAEDKQCRESLSVYLSTKGMAQECLEEGLKKHVGEIEHEDGSIKRKIKLPKQCFTLENFPSVKILIWINRLIQKVFPKGKRLLIIALFVVSIALIIVICRYHALNKKDQKAVAEYNGEKITSFEQDGTIDSPLSDDNFAHSSIVDIQESSTTQYSFDRDTNTWHKTTTFTRSTTEVIEGSVIDDDED